MPALDLAVVVPTFNERANAIELIARLHRVLEGIEHEIIVVDDDSPHGRRRARPLAAQHGNARARRSRKAA